jgi:hypothetical protein
VFDPKSVTLWLWLEFSLLGYLSIMFYYNRQIMIIEKTDFLFDMWFLLSIGVEAVKASETLIQHILIIILVIL